MIGRRRLPILQADGIDEDFSLETQDTLWRMPFMGEIRMTKKTGAHSANWLNLAGQASGAAGGEGVARVALTLRER
jgi:hypothetical protein